MILFLKSLLSVILPFLLDQLFIHGDIIVLDAVTFCLIVSSDQLLDLLISETSHISIFLQISSILLLAFIESFLKEFDISG